MDQLETTENSEDRFLNSHRVNLYISTFHFRINISEYVAVRLMVVSMQKKGLIPIFMLVLILVSISFPTLDNNTRMFKSALKPSVAPILINGDSSLSSYGLPGSGVIGDPYRIENKTINAGNNGTTAIEIRSTTKLLIIRNCSISNSGGGTSVAGIILNHCTNVFIENCTITSNQKGIYLFDSQGISITDNNILNNNGNGIYFENSNSSSVSRNLINNNHQGITLISGSQKNNIYANSFKGNTAADGSGYAWDGTGSGNAWFVGIVGNYWGNYKTKVLPPFTTNDNVTWIKPYPVNATKSQLDKYPLVSFTAHNTISIFGNAQLAAFHDKTGSGTKLDPYVIKTMIITAFGEGASCILLQDLNKYFKIFNITTSGGNTGIWLQNCTNFIIDDCKCSLNGQGCHVDSFSSNFTISNSNFSRNTEHGIYMENSFNWSMNNDYLGNNANEGLYLSPTCQNCTISKSTVEFNGGDGIYLGSVYNVTSTQNIIQNNSGSGMYLVSCTNGTLSNNTIEHNTNYGVYFSDTSYMTVNGNDIGWNYYGILLGSTSMHDMLHGNSLHSCSILFDGTNFAAMTSHVIDTSNTINGKAVIYLCNQTNVIAAAFSDAGGVILVNCTRCTISNLILPQATIGIQLFSSWNCTISNCTFNNFLSSGIYFNNSTLSTIKNCNLFNCDQSISLDQNSNNDTITGNKITSRQIGIYLEGSHGSENDSLSQNRMIGCDLQIDGPSDVVASNEIDQTNRVNNRILYYYTNLQHLTAANFYNAGQIIMYNCSYATIAGGNVSNATWGLTMLSCNYNVIMNVNASYNFQIGILALDSSYNNFTNCVINSNNGGGFAFQGSSNRVSNCTISYNEASGIQSGPGLNNIFENNVIKHDLNGYYSSPSYFGSISEHYTKIINNDISYNLQQGIFLEGTVDSLIIGNNISNNQGMGIKISTPTSHPPINNTICANIIGNNGNGNVYSNLANIWNNGTIGNCWGNYLTLYPNATTTTNACNIPFGLGIIWNTPYAINGSAGIFDTLPFYQDPPRNFRASGSSGQVSISWFAPLIIGGSPITHYKIYRGTTPGGEVYYMTIGNLLFFADTNVTLGVQYYFKIRAVNGAGDGTWSNEIKVIPINVASKPLDLLVTFNGNAVVLSWTPPSNIGGSAIINYTIYRSDSPSGKYIPIGTVNGNVTTFTDTTSLKEGQTYYYEVSAINAAGEGALSDAGSTLVPSPYNFVVLLVIIIVVIGMIVTIAIIAASARRRKKVISPRQAITPVVVKPPEISLKDALSSDAADMQRRIDEKQAILTRILEPQTKSELAASEQPLKAIPEIDALKVKKMKAGVSTEEHVDHKIDEQLEQELKPELKEERCIVCSTVLKGTSYVCPECKTKYCIRCAIELSQRHEECWACKKPLKFD